MKTIEVIAYKVYGYHEDEPESPTSVVMWPYNSEPLPESGYTDDDVYFYGVSSESLDAAIQNQHPFDGFVPTKWEAILPDSLNFAVSITVCIGGYEKNISQVVRYVYSAEDAIELAIRYESHDREDDTPPDANGWYDDVDGEISYQVREVVQIDDHTADTLERFL